MSWLASSLTVRSGLGDHMDLALVPARVLQGAVAQSEQGVVAATSHVVAGVEVRAALTDDDVAGPDLLACEHLAAKALCV